MPNLLELRDFALETKNENAIYIIQRYVNMIEDTFYHDSYFLGGQIQMKLTDDITDSIIREVESLLYYSSASSWNPGDLIDLLSNKDFNIIKDLIEEQRLQKLRMNGLLRVIVFWLSPARKRATEKVFHPNRIDFSIM